MVSADPHPDRPGEALVSRRPVHDSRARAVYAVCAVLLAAPVVALLWVSSYAQATPTFLDFPFFYWYQLLWVLVSAALTGISYALIQWVRRQPATGRGAHEVTR